MRTLITAPISIVIPLGIYYFFFGIIIGKIVRKIKVLKKTDRKKYRKYLYLVGFVILLIIALFWFIRAGVNSLEEKEAKETKTGFEKLNIGMKEKEVEEIMRQKGSRFKSATNDSDFCWFYQVGKGGRNLYNICFKNGKVIQKEKLFEGWFD